jgi:hypothetical protein
VIAFHGHQGCRELFDFGAFWGVAFHWDKSGFNSPPTEAGYRTHFRSGKASHSSGLAHLEVPHQLHRSLAPV